MSSQRQARRERNREDFIRATTQALSTSSKIPLGSTPPGATAGNTFQEHLEDEIRKAVRVYHRLTKEALDLETTDPKNSWGPEGVEHKRKATRGMIRGLCKALLIYEDSYHMNDKARLLKIEKEFLNEGKD